MRARFVLAVMAALGCAACSSGALDSFTFMEGREKPVEPNIFPADFKQQILATVPTVVEDSTGYRDAFYSDPLIDPKSTVTVYSSCVRFDPRVGNQYLGTKEYILYYYGGHLSQFVPATPDQCRFATYKPFPELEKLCLGKKCS